jgi:hypothetical protein
MVLIYRRLASAAASEDGRSEASARAGGPSRAACLALSCACVLALYFSQVESAIGLLDSLLAYGGSAAGGATLRAAGDAASGAAGGAGAPASASTAPDPNDFQLFTRVFASGAAALPARLAIARGDARARRVFTTHRCSGAWDGAVRQGNRTCAFENLYYDGAQSAPWTRCQWLLLLDAAERPRSHASVEAWAAAVAADVRDVRLGASNREMPLWFVEVLVYERTGDVRGPLNESESAKGVRPERGVRERRGRARGDVQATWVQGNEDCALWAARGEGDCACCDLDAPPHPPPPATWLCSRPRRPAVFAARAEPATARRRAHLRHAARGAQQHRTHSVGGADPLFRRARRRGL